MYVSMNWIQDFVDLSGLDLEALIQRFTLSTAEVEDVIHMGADLSGVIVGQIHAIEDHPQSKKLHLLKVDTGSGLVDCVCGAPNVALGMKVAFATVGAHVGDLVITQAKVAGYDSCGMCCSERELGISADHAGILEVDPAAPLGADIKSVYQIDDLVFEVDNKSLTNRPDLWGHYGIAREFSVLAGRPLKPIDKADCAAFAGLPPVQIQLLDPLAQRFCSIKIDNVRAKTSPLNMRIRLFYCGMRGINLLADLTNYLMLELGQPMHAYDRRKVDQVEVKRFEQPFTFRTLDGVERKIDEQTLMVCSGGEPVGIAGIMGGLESEIEDDTSSILLESATFDGVSVRKSSSRLGLRTDASMRYEKCLDPENASVAVERFVKLLLDIDPGATVISSLTDQYRTRYERVSLRFDNAYVRRYAGIEISEEQIERTLTALGFEVKREGGCFEVVVPSWRATKDVTIKADIIEEITRVYGYDNFEITTTLSPLSPVRPSVSEADEAKLKDVLVKRFSLHEVHSYIWCDESKFKPLGLDIEPNVRLVNSITNGCEVIRNSMIPSLLCIAQENRAFQPEFGIFEAGRVVQGKGEDGLCNERKRLGVVLFSRARGLQELYFHLRDLICTAVDELKHRPLEFQAAQPIHNWEHPVNLAALSCAGMPLGRMGILHPANQAQIDGKAVIVFAELDLTTLAQISNAGIAFQEPSKFPGIEIDLSFRTASYQAIKQVIDQVAPPDLKGVSVVDLYNLGKEDQSISIRVAFSSKDRTLTRTEIQPSIDAIVDKLKDQGILLKG